MSGAIRVSESVFVEADSEGELLSFSCLICGYRGYSLHLLGLQLEDSIVVCNEDSIVEETKSLRYATKKTRPEALPRGARPE